MNRLTNAELDQTIEEATNQILIAARALKIASREGDENGENIAKTIMFKYLDLHTESLGKKELKEYLNR